VSDRPAWRSAVLRCEKCRAKVAVVGVEVAPDVGRVWWAMIGRPEVEEVVNTAGMVTVNRAYRSGLLLDDREHDRLIFKCGACGRSDIQVSHRRIREWLGADAPPRVVYA